MNETFKKSLCKLLVVVLIGLAIFGIYKFNHRWDEENFIGLSAEQIISRYGEFYSCLFWDTTGNYRRGVYRIGRDHVGLFGMTYEEYVIIGFDENGIACYYLREPVAIGG